jgi:hypothetical protein
MLQLSRFCKIRARPTSGPEKEEKEKCHAGSFPGKRKTPPRGGAFPERRFIKEELVFSN